MLKFFSKLFGSKKEKDVSELYPVVAEINEHYATLQSLSDDDLRGKTQEFKTRIAEAISEVRGQIDGIQAELKTVSEPLQREELFNRLEALEKEEYATIKETLNEILPEAFAVVKETCRRLVGQEWDVVGHKMKWEMVPYDVQLMGGIVQHQGKISEMATGEGKTLVAVAPMYLNALSGRGVHLVTVNDYLARRDSEWMGKVFHFHGMTVGCIVQNQNPFVRREQYNCDITYGTNNEFGFDYLRDNMVHTPDEMVQRGHHYAIVDEVDSVLIDEARTPLIISGPVEVDDNKYNEMKPRVERLVSTQRNFIAKIVGEAEKLFEEGKTKEAGILFLRSYRGDPKNKKLAKMFAEGAPKKLMIETESEYMAEQNKRMHEIDDELYYSIDEKNHSIDLTEKGREYLASGMDKDMFILPDIGAELSAVEGDESIPFEQKQLKKDELNKIYADRSDRVHTVRQLLRSYALYEKDVEYVVTEDGKVQIVDEFTGRILHGRRYSDGLHQAIEAKEGVQVERDTQTLATVTLQNYFRLYKKLAGMTGTAETEAAEFFDIYKLDVVVIPTNQPVVRLDLNDLVYRTKREKYNAVIGEIRSLREKKQPVLVGTTNVEVSETISRMLTRERIPHNVLNAKQHQREAEIISNAGLGGAVTIATNMAGRGTDIKLGPGVVQAGGLAIIGTERHEARRIDRQLRGRAGRQGDPGMSKFFLSLEDDLMRLFGSDRIASIMTKMGAEEGEVIEHPMITRMIERAQKKVEENNFGIRKRLLEYDNVMNQQREVIYAKRRHALLGEHLEDEINQMLDDYVADVVERHYEAATIDEMKDELRSNLLINLEITPAEFQSLGIAGVSERVMSAANEFLKRKRETVGDDAMNFIQKIALLQVIDARWKEHLREMDDLKEGIYLRAYGQKDPILEYKTEAYKMFIELIGLVNKEALNLVFKLFPENQQQLQTQQQRRALQRDRITLTHAASTGMGMQGTIDSEAGEPRQQQAPKVQQIISGEKVGRNDPCPCGSGKKYKNCHGKGA
jgi:preprotein translocase subunit SecA